MKKFWIFLFIALLGGSIAGERARAFLSDGFAFFWRTTPDIIFSRPVPLRENTDNVPVIGKHLDGFASVLFAAAGENDGIRESYRVITHDDEYVGHIKHASLKASQVVLASRPGERFTGWLPVLSAPLELQGWGSGLLRALIPISFPVEVGDDVWYDARLDAFVGNVVAVQGEIKNTDDEDVKEIFVRHVINPLMLSSVSIRP